MSTFLNTQRFKALVSVVTSLVLASGCRSASVNSDSSVSPAPDGVALPPFYRSYDRSPGRYDDEPTQSPSSQPVPPAVLPVPGYSEPEVPPSPSTQKSKWNLLPSGFKFPSLNRPNSDVRQTGAKSDNLGSSARIGKIQQAPALLTLRDQADDVVVETVRPRTSAPRFRPEPAPIAAVGTNVGESPDLSIPAASDITPPLRTPINTRFGVINDWPYAKGQLRPPANQTAPADPQPAALSAERESTGTPLLLPPSL